MNTRLLLITTSLMLALACSALRAASTEWSLELGTDSGDIDCWVDQVVADGRGGCVAVWALENTVEWTNTTYVARFDKKGAIVWQQVYSNVYIEISYVSKRRVVYSVDYDIGDDEVVIVDKKGQVDTIGDPNVEIACDMNSEIGPTADKRGCFVAYYDKATQRNWLVRYSYK